jgi:hypothetical protein
MQSCPQTYDEEFRSKHARRIRLAARVHASFIRWICMREMLRGIFLVSFCPDIHLDSGHEIAFVIQEIPSLIKVFYEGKILS